MFVVSNMHDRRELFNGLAEAFAKMEVAHEGNGDKGGSEPVLLKHSSIDYNDETLPLKGGHKIE